MSRIEELGIEVHPHVGRVVIALSGELDSYSVSDVRSVLREVVDAGGASQVVLDLDRLSFIDSTGLGAIVWAADALRQQQRQLHLEHLPPPILRVFEITGLTGHLIGIADRSAPQRW